MLQRGNSDAAKRVRRAKAGPSPKRERRITITDPAVLHEQAVVGAVRAHEVAYGLPRSSMEKDGPSRANRPSIERQGSHISRHLSNASSKGKPARPRPARTTTANARIETTPSRPPTAATTVVSAQYQFAGPGAHIQASRRKHRSDRKTDESMSEAAPPPRNRLKKKASFVKQPAASSPGPDRPAMSATPVANKTSPIVPPRPATSQTTTLCHQVEPNIRPETPGLQHDAGRGQKELRQTPSLASLSFLKRRPKHHNDQRSDDISPAMEENKAAESDTLRKSRRISVGITTTIRRVFGRRPTSLVVEIPPQQVQAGRPHYGSESTSASRRISFTTSRSVSNEHSDHHSSHSPPPVPSLGRRDAYGDQVGTLAPADYYYTRSRVTSWMTDSSKDHTTKLRELESHLPSILENPQRNFSQAASLHDAHGQHLQHDMEMFEDGGDDQEAQASTPDDQRKLDSRRLLSALRTHMTTNQRRQQRSTETRTVSKSTQQSWQSSGRSATPMEHHGEAEQEPVVMEASIRDFATPDFPFVAASAEDSELEDDNIPSPRARENMMSPSIYSFRPGVAEKHPQDSSISLPDRALSPEGVAYVTESHQVSKWSLAGNASPTKPAISTSGEWRSWAAEEFADLEPGATETDLVIKHRANPFSKRAERRASMDAAKVMDSALKQLDLNLEQNLPLARPKLLDTKSDSMNDRFPMLPIAKKNKKSSPSSSRKTSSSKASTAKVIDGESSVVSQSSTGNLKADNAPITRKPSNLALHVMSSSEMDAPAIPPRPQMRTREQSTREQRRAARLPSKAPTMKEQPSLAHLLAEERSREVAPQQAAELINPLDDKFLSRFQRGPYAQENSSLPSKASSVDSADLLSRRKGTGVGGLVKGGMLGGGGDENARLSPTKGQIMVDEFLGKRGSRGWREVEESAGHGSSPRFL